MPRKPAPQKPKKSIVRWLRLQPSEDEKIQKLAEAENRSVASQLRTIVTQRLESVKPPSESKPNGTDK